MTKFDKSKFTSGEYAMYEGKFVARFKRGSRASFINFLVKNFTVEEYFQKLEGEKLAPLPILESKGYLLPHIKKHLKEGGYEVSRAGLDKMIQDRITARHARA